MTLVVRRQAAEQVRAIHDSIAADNPRAARSTVDRIYACVERVAESATAYSDRPGRRRGTRELIEPPYILNYRVDERRSEIVSLSVVHGARRR